MIGLRQEVAAEPAGRSPCTKLLLYSLIQDAALFSTPGSPSGYGIIA